MGKKPSKCFRRIKSQSYSRLEYISRVPDLVEGLAGKLVMGDTAIRYPAKLTLIAQKDGQLSDKSLLMLRILVNKDMKLLETKDANGVKANYRMEIKAHPHEIVRAHGLVGIAKAERLQKGMRLGFGVPCGRFARVHKGGSVIEITTNDEPIALGLARRALEHGMRKLAPLSWTIQKEGYAVTTQNAQVMLPKRIKEKKSSGGRAEVPREL